ncbi:hypothetical protein ACEPAH_8551 [Sanghuangporus vaninii]
MRVTDFPPELLREIIRLSVDAPISYSSVENGASCFPMMSSEPYQAAHDNGWSPKNWGRSSPHFSDKLAVALVCREFWIISNEFLYAVVSLSKASQAVNLAHGLTHHATRWNPAPGSWVRELEIRSYFELDESTTNSLKCILDHCTGLSALRISGSFLDRRHPSEITHILSAVPPGLVHFEFDAISIFSRRDRELAYSENGLYDTLNRLAPSLRNLKLLASRYLYLFSGRSNVLVGLTRLELCFSSPDLQMMSNACGDPSIGSWPLESLTHLSLSYVPVNRDDTPMNFLLSLPPPSSMLFPISRRVTFPLDNLLAAAPNLRELEYQSFSLHSASLWRQCSSASLRHIVVRADGVSYSELHRNRMFDSLREQVHPLASKVAFPSLQGISVVSTRRCISTEIIARSLGFLKVSGIDVQPKVVEGASDIDEWFF